MKPDRSNYEIWLIDWLDGILDQAQVEQLMLFLDENPDIREEADSLALTTLSPEKSLLSGKDSLRKTTSELTTSQIEFLSVAYLENDLSPDNLVDLKQNIGLNCENKTLFESIQKIKLVPSDQEYKLKNQLIKQSAGERALRYSFIVFSAAASIALIILSFIFVPRFISEKKAGFAQNIINNSIKMEPFVVRTEVYYSSPEESVIKNSPVVRSLTTGLLPFSTDTVNTFDNLIFYDSSAIINRVSLPMISRVPVHIKADVKRSLPDYILIASNNNYKEPAYYDDNRSRLSKFLTRTFREKILKEEIINDKPLLPFEIAEAGIEGLNNLLGWNMAVVKTSNEEGELKSIYFSSRVLKFNAPVKNTESTP